MQREVCGARGAILARSIGGKHTINELKESGDFIDVSGILANL
jgi:hypothetical protein